MSGVLVTYSNIQATRNKWQKEDNEIQSAFTYVEKYLRNMKSVPNSVYFLGFSYNMTLLKNFYFYFEVIIDSEITKK